MKFSVSVLFESESVSTELLTYIVIFIVLQVILGLEWTVLLLINLLILLFSVV